MFCLTFGFMVMITSRQHLKPTLELPGVKDLFSHIGLKNERTAVSPKYPFTWCYTLVMFLTVGFLVFLRFLFPHLIGCFFMLVVIFSLTFLCGCPQSVSPVYPAVLYFPSPRMSVSINNPCLSLYFKILNLSVFCYCVLIDEDSIVTCFCLHIILHRKIYSYVQVLLCMKCSDCIL